MVPNVLSFAFGIVADHPDAVQRQIGQIGRYIKTAMDGLYAWLAHNPNEFIIALSAAVTAVFTVILAVATIRLWNSTAELAVEPQQVVLGQTEAADGCFGF
jgi:hypothetical protein